MDQKDLELSLKIIYFQNSKTGKGPLVFTRAYIRLEAFSLRSLLRILLYAATNQTFFKRLELGLSRLDFKLITEKSRKIFDWKQVKAVLILISLVQNIFYCAMLQKKINMSG